PTALAFLGYLADGAGRRVNLKALRFRPAGGGGDPGEGLLVVGTAMNNGETTTGAELVKAPPRRGGGGGPGQTARRRRPPGRPRRFPRPRRALRPRLQRLRLPLHVPRRAGGTARPVRDDAGRCRASPTGPHSAGDRRRRAPARDRDAAEPRGGPAAGRRGATD